MEMRCPNCGKPMQSKFVETGCFATFGDPEDGPTSGYTIYTCKECKISCERDDCGCHWNFPKHIKFTITQKQRDYLDGLFRGEPPMVCSKEFAQALIAEMVDAQKKADEKRRFENHRDHILQEHGIDPNSWYEGWPDDGGFLQKLWPEGVKDADSATMILRLRCNEDGSLGETKLIVRDLAKVQQEQLNEVKTFINKIRDDLALLTF